MSEAAQSEIVPAPGPWGAGMTLVFGGAIFFVYALVQGVAMAPLLILQGDGPAAANLPKVGGLGITGLNLAVAIAASAPVLILLSGIMAALRRGPLIGEYLALRPVRWLALAGWVLGMVLLVMGLSTLNELLQRPPSEFIVGTYSTAGHAPFFWCAVALAAPAAEETFFRGFLFPGLQRSRLGGAGTVLVTSLGFAIVHGGQYDWFEVTQVAIVGLAFGFARLRSGSLLPPLAMHITLNLASLVIFALHGST